MFEPPGGVPRGYSLERGREGLRYCVERSDADVLLAVDGDSVVGLASVYLNRAFVRFGDRCWLQDLVVTASRRSEGIGALLVDAATDWAKERGCTQLELISGADRKDAHRFYRAQGMRESMAYTREIYD